MSTAKDVAMSVAREFRRVPILRQAYEATDPSRRARLLVRSGLIDTQLYAAQLGVETVGLADAAAHYVAWGHWAGLTINPLLDDRSLRDGLPKSGRPIAYDYLRRRSWDVPVSPLWDSRAYLRAHPESADHPAGPAGHLWDRVRRDPDVQIPAREGSVSWRTLEALHTQASREWGESDKVRRLRRLRRHFSGVESVGEWPRGVPEPKVSIILATWNRSGELRHSVDSVMRQTWRNWELLIVDDGSWDDTPTIANLLSDRDERIRYLRRPHSGVSAARNAGLSVAMGQFVAFLDSDNSWEPDFLRNMVVAMCAENWSAAYATLEMDNDDRKLFREVDEVTEATLAHGNVVDLNTLVVDRQALLDIGGFDESLERAVDYDLILSLSRRHTLHHVPVLGAVYSNRNDALDRISTSKPLGWNTLVRHKHLIDWNSLAEKHLDAGASVAIAITREDPALVEKLEVARTLARLHGFEVLVAMIMPTPSDWLAATAAASGVDGLHPKLLPVPEPFAHVVAQLLVLATRDRFAFIEPTSLYTAEAVAALVSRVEPEQRRAVAPLLVNGDGTVVTVGAAFPRRAATPIDLLSRHPQQDAEALGDDIVVPSLSGRTFAIPTRHLQAVRGLNPLLYNEYELPALAVALNERYATYEFATCSSIRFRRVPAKYDFELLDRRGNISSIHAITSAVEPTNLDALLRPLDLTVPHFRSVPVNEASSETPHLVVADDDTEDVPSPTHLAKPSLRHLQPVVVRHRRTVRLGQRTVPRLRWAIRVASPAWPTGGEWGDTHFARSLARGLESLGQEVVIDHHEIHNRPTSYLDDVVLVLRGLDRVEPRPDVISMLWVISHPDQVTKDEIQRFDRVFAASSRWARTSRDRWGIDITPLLQCTDPDVFHPQGLKRSPDIVFVGKSRGVARPSVVHPLRAGVPVRVYGGEWEGIIPPGAVLSEYVPNAEVSPIYEQASMILNDHWHDMRRHGFISNRLFDAVAAGGRVLSDDVEGISDLFRGAVVTYQDTTDLLRLVRAEHDSLFPRDEELFEIASHIREEHSFKARAATLLEAALESLDAR